MKLLPTLIIAFTIAMPVIASHADPANTPAPAPATAPAATPATPAAATKPAPAAKPAALPVVNVDPNAPPDVTYPYTFICVHCGMKMTVKSKADWKKSCDQCACGMAFTDCRPKKK